MASRIMTMISRELSGRLLCHLPWLFQDSYSLSPYTRSQVPVSGSPAISGFAWCSCGVHLCVVIQWFSVVSETLWQGSWWTTFGGSWHKRHISVQGLLKNKEACAKAALENMNTQSVYRFSIPPGGVFQTRGVDDMMQKHTSIQ